VNMEQEILGVLREIASSLSWISGALWCIFLFKSCSK
jgi:hypothetical protein